MSLILIILTAALIGGAVQMYLQPSHAGRSSARWMHPVYWIALLVFVWPVWLALMIARNAKIIAAGLLVLLCAYAGFVSATYIISLI